MNTSIYQNIATRTAGDIYIGVVGPVRPEEIQMGQVDTVQFYSLSIPRENCMSGN